MKKNQKGISILGLMAILAVVVTLLIIAVRYYQGFRKNALYPTVAYHLNHNPCPL